MAVSKKKICHPQPFPLPTGVFFTTREITLLRATWSAMKEDPTLERHQGLHSSQASAFFCQQFYDNLLSDHPHLKELFPSIHSQGAAMAGILRFVISNLEDLSQLQQVLMKLGKWHSRIIGLTSTYYEYVGNALLRTLSDRRGSQFTLEEEDVWIKLYSYIANTMLTYGEDPMLVVKTEDENEKLKQDKSSNKENTKKDWIKGSNPLGIPSRLMYSRHLN